MNLAYLQKSTVANLPLQPILLQTHVKGTNAQRMIKRVRSTITRRCLQLLLQLQLSRFLNHAHCYDNAVHVSSAWADVIPNLLN